MHSVIHVEHRAIGILDDSMGAMLSSIGPFHWAYGEPIERGFPLALHRNTSANGHNYETMLSINLLTVAYYSTSHEHARDGY